MATKKAKPLPRVTLDSIRRETFPPHPRPRPTWKQTHTLHPVRRD